MGRQCTILVPICPNTYGTARWYSAVRYIAHFLYQYLQTMVPGTVPCRTVRYRTEPSIVPYRISLEHVAIIPRIITVVYANGTVRHGFESICNYPRDNHARFLVLHFEGIVMYNHMTV